MFGLKEKHIELINQCFEKYQPIELVIIYGSRALGNYRPGSDIDLAIVSNDPGFPQLMKLENELDDLLLPYKMDIVVKGKISNPALVKHIENFGKVFYDKTKKLAFSESPVEYRVRIKNTN